MEPIGYSYYDIDRLVKEYNGQRSEPTEKHGSVRAAKWQDQKGPNPLMLMGLDRS
ncbi:hypothetical protein [Roseibium sp. MMSF_3544]|uniref:hypothetical protein n=1 Tax=unclassified Roseibium TaxID=2629323 RepID=UPI00273F8FA4|nr:hypothetical protein [Roseibium sp. MMSF_3544]